MGYGDGLGLECIPGIWGTLAQFSVLSQTSSSASGKLRQCSDSVPSQYNGNSNAVLTCGISLVINTSRTSRCCASVIRTATSAPNVWKSDLSSCTCWMLWGTFLTALSKPVLMLHTCRNFSSSFPPLPLSESWYSGGKRWLLGQWHRVSIHYRQNLIWLLDPANGALVLWDCSLQILLEMHILKDPSSKLMRSEVAQGNMVKHLMGFVEEHPDSIRSQFLLGNKWKQFTGRVFCMLMYMQHAVPKPIGGRCVAVFLLVVYTNRPSHWFKVVMLL